MVKSGGSPEIANHFFPEHELGKIKSRGEGGGLEIFPVPIHVFVFKYELGKMRPQGARGGSGYFTPVNPFAIKKLPLTGLPGGPTHFGHWRSAAGRSPLGRLEGVGKPQAPQ